MDSDFISKHLQYHTNKHDYVTNYYNSYIFHKAATNTTYAIYSKPRIPFSCESSQFTLICSINGLLLLTDSYSFGKTIYLWKLKIIKYYGSNTIEDYLIRSFITVGLGYHPTADDYMVVWINQSGFYDGHRVRPKHLPPEVKLYSLANNTWKNIEPNFGGSMVRTDQLEKTTVYIHGAIHWIACRIRNKYFIWKFDFFSEEFGEIDLPKCDVHEFCGKYLLVLNESLGFLYFCYHVNECNIWVMMEYGISESWTKQYVVDLDERCEGCLGVINDRELLIRFHGDNVISYDVYTKEGKLVEIGDHKGDWEDWDGFTNNLLRYKDEEECVRAATKEIIAKCL